MKYIIIDTREDFEFSSGHVEGAINIPPAQFMTGDVPSQLRDVAKDAPIIVYCRTGSRSNVVSHVLEQQGFTHITNGINQGHVEQLLSK